MHGDRMRRAVRCGERDGGAGATGGREREHRGEQVQPAGREGAPHGAPCLFDAAATQRKSRRTAATWAAARACVRQDPLREAPVLDDDGLRELYAGSRRRLVVQLTALTGDATEAEDVVQEAFARALGKWKRIRDYDNPEAWVYTVAVNIARSRWRRARMAAVSLPRLHGRTTPPELSSDHVVLLDALRMLPERQREAVVLHHIGDISVEDTAVRMGAPVGTVKSWLSRARHALATELNVDEEVATNG